MRLIYVIPLALLASSAMADERKFSLAVTQSELGVIGTALGEMPYKSVAPLIQSITAQIDAQTNLPPKPPAKQHKSPERRR